MIVNGEPAVFRDLDLTAFDLTIEKLLDAAALQADEVVVVAAFVQFEYRLAAFLEMMADEQPGLRELGEHSIHRRQSHIHVFRQQQPVDVFGGQVPDFARFKQIEDFQPRQRGFEPDVFQIAGSSHRLEFPDLQAIIVTALAPGLQTLRPERSTKREFMLHRLLLISLSLTLAACFSIPLSPHKIDVQQGNYVDQDMVAKLKPGMTRAQVRFVLGTPLVADPFHANRWDYAFLRQKNGGAPEHRKITVIFEDDKLARVDGDIIPGNVAEDAKPKVTKAAPSKPAAGAAGPVNKAAEDKSLKEKVETLIAEKEAQGKDESELRKSLAKLLGVEERQLASELPRAKTVNGREKAPPPPQQAKSELPKAKAKKAVQSEKPKVASEKSSDNGLRASGLSADVLSALGVRYEGDGKPAEEEVVAEDEEEGAGKPAKKKTARKSNLKADGLSADVLRTLGVPFEGDGSEAAEQDEAVAEGEEKAAKEERGGVLDELKNAEGKSVKQQLAEKFGMGDKPKPKAEEVAEEEGEQGPPTFMDDMRTVLGLGPSEKRTKGENAKAEDDSEEDVEAEDGEPQKPTFWDDVRTVLGLD